MTYDDTIMLHPTFEWYQRRARRTANYPADIDLLYVTLGLVGEAGEVANKVKKVYRDDHGELTTERKQQIMDEAGDCMWYVASLCDVLGVNMGDLANMNLEKLANREERAVVHGDGDER